MESREQSKLLNTSPTSEPDGKMESQFLDFLRTRDEKTFKHFLFIKIYIDLQNRVKETSAATQVGEFRKDV